MIIQEFITNNFKETQKMGGRMAQEIFQKSSKKALLLCLEGDLGAGKTTFTQGLLKGLGAEGPYTSPTFLIMKEYRRQEARNKKQISNKSAIQNIYHIDAYRVGAEDVLNLGWEEIISDPKNIVIVEWPERIKKILPKNSVKIKFEWMDENQRKITFEK